MGYYVLDLADVCRDAGLRVVEVDGWQSRARGSGGFADGKPDHCCIHHTASGPSSDGWPDVNYMTFNDDDAPLANLYLDRSGTVYVMAAGATNTNGKGDCAHLDPDSMNSSAIGIEAGNDGVGEPWPEPQTTAYSRLTAALCDVYGIGSDRVHAHAEWAPDRKVDPYGPSPWGNQTWDMDAFRADLAAPPAPTPEPEPPEEDDVKIYLVKDGRTGAYYATDWLTGKLHVPNGDAAAEGVRLFGWIGWAGTEEPTPIGRQWDGIIDTLPTIGADHG